MWSSQKKQSQNVWKTREKQRQTEQEPDLSLPFVFVEKSAYPACV
jgi:hypothetical protein